MQNEFIDKFGELCRTASKPLTEITELNVRTFNKLTKNTDQVESLFQAKKPEDFVSAQLHLANLAGIETMKYAQEACSIWLEAATNFGKVFTDTIRETAARTAAVTKSASREKDKDRSN